MTAKNKGKEVHENNAEQEEKKHPSVDGGYAWVILIAAFVSFSLNTNINNKKKKDKNFIQTFIHS